MRSAHTWTRETQRLGEHIHEASVLDAFVENLRRSDSKASVRLHHGGGFVGRVCGTLGGVCALHWVEDSGVGNSFGEEYMHWKSRSHWFERLLRVLSDEGFTR